MKIYKILQYHVGFFYIRDQEIKRKESEIASNSKKIAGLTAEVDVLSQTIVTKDTEIQEVQNESQMFEKG